MKEDGDIETMFSRFQILVSRLQVLNKSYTTFDLVKKILRSLPARYMPKVIGIQEAKYLKTLSLKSLIRNIQSHEMKLNGDVPAKKSKSHALKFIAKYAKAPQVWEFGNTSHIEGSKEDSYDEEMDFIIKRFKYLTRKNKGFSGRSSDFGGSSSRDNKDDHK